MSAAAKKTTSQYYGTGRRKSSSARVYLRPGKGVVTVNGRSLEAYFTRKTAQVTVREPFGVVAMDDRFDVLVMVRGGGISGQADAVRLGIARALVQFDEETGAPVEVEATSGEEAAAAPDTFRRKLRRRGLLTRDARRVERKKVGLKKARKRPQFSKR